MKDEFETTGGGTSGTSLSKRGARRVIQRALVLIGRDKGFRQRTRGLTLNTQWTIEDWDLEWTALLAEGRLESHRGHTGRPQTSFRWKTGEDFMNHIASGESGGFELECRAVSRPLAEMILARFRTTLKAVLENPVGDDGARLA